MVDGKTSADLTAQRDDERPAIYLARMAGLAALTEYHLRVIADCAHVPAHDVPLADTQTAMVLWEHQMVGQVRLAARAAAAFLDTIDMMVN